VSASRAEIRERLGPPTEQLGSPTEPRVRRERGHVWNEEWIYIDSRSGDVERIVLWHRGDLQGAFIVMQDGSWVPEPTAAS
jgi:hypothetical protein